MTRLKQKTADHKLDDLRKVMLGDQAIWVKSDMLYQNGEMEASAAVFVYSTEDGEPMPADWFSDEFLELVDHIVWQEILMEESV